MYREYFDRRKRSQVDIRSISSDTHFRDNGSHNNNDRSKHTNNQPSKYANRMDGDRSATSLDHFMSSFDKENKRRSSSLASAPLPSSAGRRATPYKDRLDTYLPKRKRRKKVASGKDISLDVLGEFRMSRPTRMQCLCE